MKLDLAMSHCDRLEATLTTTEHPRVLEALVHEALTPARQAVTETAE